MCCWPVEQKPAHMHTTLQETVEYEITKTKQCDRVLVIVFIQLVNKKM